jgi:hypothetical protein
MKSYSISFVGRPIGALGVEQRHTVEVEAEDTEAAKLKLYESYEHIHLGSIKIKILKTKRPK